MTAVRVATADDVPALSGLRRAWTEENAGRPVEDPSFEAVFADWFEREAGQRVTWLALDGDRAVGMLNLLVFTRMPRPSVAEAAALPGRWGYVANVYVVPGDRDRGIGRRLLDAATAHADEQGSPGWCSAPASGPCRSTSGPGSRRPRRCCSARVDSLAGC